MFTMSFFWTKIRFAVIEPKSKSKNNITCKFLIIDNSTKFNGKMLIFMFYQTKNSFGTVSEYWEVYVGYTEYFKTILIRNKR